MITGLHALYLLLIATLIGIEHFTFGRWWRHNELARWVMGVATVKGLSFCLVLVVGDASGFDVWLWDFFGFGVAGAVKVSLVIQAQANTRQRGIEELERIRSGEADE